MAIADLDKNFRLKELVDQPWYYELLARERERERGSETTRTAIKLSICKKFNEVAAISGLDVVACAIDQHCKNGCEVELTLQVTSNIAEGNRVSVYVECPHATTLFILPNLIFEKLSEI